MAPKINKQRMCISCRERGQQETLLRLQCLEKQLKKFSGEGRSFYLCEACFESKRTSGMLARQCKSGAKDILMNQLREIIIDVRKS